MATLINVICNSTPYPYCLPMQMFRRKMNVVIQVGDLVVVDPNNKCNNRP